VVATPAGQHHEIGAMLASVQAAVEGWQVIYLGPNLPATSIANAAVTTGSLAVALSLIYPIDDPRLPGELKNLRGALPPDVLMIIGGQAAEAYQSVLDGIGAMWLPNAPNLRLALDLVQMSEGNDNWPR
jgi:methylmalonyl-CoA mutase cobalamin-binding subunit